jgi:hypothetical protein
MRGDSIRHMYVCYDLGQGGWHYQHKFADICVLERVVQI